MSFLGSTLPHDPLPTQTHTTPPKSILYQWLGSRKRESEAKRDAESSKHSEQYQRAIDDAAAARDERDAAKAMVSDAQQAASAAREEAAELRGQLKGFELQTNELVKQLKSVTAVAKKQ